MILKFERGYKMSGFGNEKIFVRPVCLFVVFVGLLIVSLPPLPAVAAVTYTYSGDNFTDFKNTSLDPRLFSMSDHLSLTLTFSDYLDTSGAYQDIDTASLTFWQMTAGPVTFGSNYGDVIDTLAVAVTRSNGPSSWGVGGIRGSDLASSFFTYGGPLSISDPSDQVIIVYPYFEEGGQGVYATNSAMVFSSPGIWSVSSEPVPVPSALPLLGSGLAILGLLRGRMLSARSKTY